MWEVPHCSAAKEKNCVCQILSVHLLVVVITYFNTHGGEQLQFIASSSYSIASQLAVGLAIFRGCDG